MTQPIVADRIHLAVVIGTTEDVATVMAGTEESVVPYASFFPAPRVERVSPGHLVAIASGAIVWRWYDAVVQQRDGASVRLWEPGHGSVVAAPRDPGRRYRPGTRAYLSAGLPGAEWWVAGSAVDRVADADVDLREVETFLSELGLLEG